MALSCVAPELPSVPSGVSCVVHRMYRPTRPPPRGLAGGDWGARSHMRTRNKWLAGYLANGDAQGARLDWSHSAVQARERPGNVMSMAMEMAMLGPLRPSKHACWSRRIRLEGGFDWAMALFIGRMG
ncbi:hypothetical protein E4U21_006967 [Claviceps maximensis]|nr:hypothetical protein E4U21_006967 [Claviceps maximensis]